MGIKKKGATPKGKSRGGEVELKTISTLQIGKS